MNEFDYERKKKLLEILIGLKFFYIILASLNIISYYNIALNEDNIQVVIIIVCCIVLFMVLCSKMVYGDMEKSFFNRPVIYNLIEIIVLLGLFVALMASTGGSKSSFKYIGSVL